MSDNDIVPRNTEAEQSILATVMVYGTDSFDQVSDNVSASDFFHHQHQEIFAAILSLSMTSKPIDVISVIDWLKSNHRMAKAGGEGYVNQIAASHVDVGSLPRHAEIVREKKLLRDLLSASAQIQELALSPGEVKTRIDAAQSLVMAIGEKSSSTGPVSIAEVIAHTTDWMQQRADSGAELTGVSTGFADFDKMTSGLQSGDLIIIAGRPSMGKTAFALNIAENVAIDEDLPVAVFSLEMSKLQLGLRTLASVGGIELEKVRNPTKMTSDDDWGRLSEAMDKLSRKKLFIDETSSITASQVLSRSRKLKRMHGLGLIVVDYLQLMGDGSTKSRNRTEVIGEISRSLKQIAKDLGVPVIALSQLSRQVESRANKRPMLSDLRESGSIEQDADLICFMYRDDYYNPESPHQGVAEVIFSKQRMGPTGRIGLLFKKSMSKFVNYTGALPDEESSHQPAHAGFSRSKMAPD